MRGGGINMRQLNDGSYQCNFCGKTYTRFPQADTCEKSHNMIYVPMTEQELTHLVLFLHTRDMAVLDQSLIRRLINYKKVKNGNDMSPLFTRG